MSVLGSLLAHPAIRPLGWTLLHFLWEGAAVALLLAGALRLLRNQTANARYLAACAALLVMAAAPGLTMLALHSSPAAPSFPSREIAQQGIDRLFENAKYPASGNPSSENAKFRRELTRRHGGAESDGRNVMSGGSRRPGPFSPFPLREPPCLRVCVLIRSGFAFSPLRAFAFSNSRSLLSGSQTQALEPFLPVLVAGWLTGVLLLSLRLLGGWIAVQRLPRRRSRPITGVLAARGAELGRRLGIGRPVILLESDIVPVPTMLGWLRTVILLPAGALTGLPPAQLEALLAHELAHIRRHDYLVNLLQAAVETVLFYHPAVWWVSARIRIEREHCCDDLAVRALGDRLTYARALTTLETLRGAPTPLALAGSGGDLLARIRRILGLPPQQIGRSPAALGGTMVLALLLTTAALLHVSAADPPRPAAPRTGDVVAAQAHRLAQPQPTAPHPEMDGLEPTAPHPETAGRQPTAGEGPPPSSHEGQPPHPELAGRPAGDHRAAHPKALPRPSQDSLAMECARHNVIRSQLAVLQAERALYELSIRQHSALARGHHPSKPAHIQKRGAVSLPRSPRLSAVPTRLRFVSHGAKVVQIQFVNPHAVPARISPGSRSFGLPRPARVPLASAGRTRVALAGTAFGARLARQKPATRPSSPAVVQGVVGRQVEDVAILDLRGVPARQVAQIQSLKDVAVVILDANNRGALRASLEDVGTTVVAAPDLRVSVEPYLELSKATLEAMPAGQKLLLVGVIVFQPDVTPALIAEKFASLQVTGVLVASAAVRGALFGKLQITGATVPMPDNPGPIVHSLGENKLTVDYLSRLSNDSIYLNIGETQIAPDVTEELLARKIQTYCNVGETTGPSALINLLKTRCPTNLGSFNETPAPAR